MFVIGSIMFFTGCPGIVEVASSEPSTVKVVPSKASNTYIKKYETAYQYQNSNSYSNFHQVKCGESLSKIAIRYGISLCRIIQLNSWIKNPNRIEIGWMIRLR